MKLFFSFVFIILGSVCGLGDENDIDFTQVELQSNNIIKQPVILADPNTKIESNRKVKGRIINGTKATTIKDFPYQVKLYLRSSTEGTERKPVYSTCGGSIIGRRWIVTAAHCLDKALEGYVYVGCVNTLEKNVRKSRTCQKIYVTPDRYFWHWRFINNEDDTQNDIGVIRLQKPLKFSDSVNKIELNKNPDIQPDQTVVLSGYGITENGMLSDTLKSTSVKILDEITCKETFPTVNSTMICFGANGYTSDCQGDSGGPMTMKENGITTLVGITSYGGPTCLDYPGVYTRVSAFLDWICWVTGIGDSECQKRRRERIFHHKLN